VGRIDPFHIKGGIGFGISKGLGFLQHVREGTSLVGHLCQYVVGCSVQDPQKALNTVGNEAFFHRSDQRDAAPDTGLETNLNPLFQGSRKNLVAVSSQQGLVGCNHLFSLFNGFKHEAFGWLISPD